MERKEMEKQHEKQLDQEISERSDQKQSCKKCGSKFVYIRIKEKSVVCRSCGNIDLMED